VEGGVQAVLLSLESWEFCVHLKEIMNLQLNVRHEIFSVFKNMKRVHLWMNDN
jgi:hypothetical protein